MISWNAFAAIALLELGMAVIPGPNMIYLASRSITQGRRAGLVSLGGTAVGFGVYLVAAVAGLSTLFASVPLAYITVKLVGAVYLVYLAWTILKPGGRSVFSPDTDIKPAGHSRLFLMGFLTNLLNPKIAVLYAALLPQFIDVDAGPVWLQMLQLGGVQIAVGVAVNGVVVFAASSISRSLARSPRLVAAQRFTAGGLLGVFALRTAVSVTPASA